MKAAIFGASGRTGGFLLAEAVARGVEIKALVRDPSWLSQNSACETVHGDVLDQRMVDATVSGTDVVLSALGHSDGSTKDLFTTAISNIVRSMGRQGPKRIVVLTNEAVSDKADKLPIVHKAANGMMRVTMAGIFRDTVQEAGLIRESGLDWTMVRAGVLTNGPRTEYSAGPVTSKSRLRVSRADVGNFMIKCAVEGLFVRQTPFICGGP